MSNGKFGGNSLKRDQIFSTVHLVLWILLVIIIYNNVMLPALRSDKPFGITDNNRQVTIIDFPSHFNFAKEVWLSKKDRNPESSVYTVEHHLKVVSKWAGSKIEHSLSFGYSPTMVWLLAPMVFLSHAAAFSILNFAGLLSIWWQTRPLRCRFGIGILSFFSPLYYACAYLGQTSLLTGAGLLYIAENSRTDLIDKDRTKSIISTGVVLWMLTAKPPLAVTAGVVLLTLRQWQPILVALILTTIMTLAITPLLGANWVNDYLALISTHNLVEADKAFAFSHCPPHMANLRAILNVDFKIADNIASMISSIVWLCTLVWMLIAGVRLRLQHEAYWALGILFYLLFCPHVTSTEELQLILLLPLCIPVMKEKLNQRELALFAIILLLPFMSPAVGPLFLDIRWGLLSAKLFLVFFIVYHYWGSRALNAETLTGKLMAI